jgi:hypothetical protein
MGESALAGKNWWRSKDGWLRQMQMPIDASGLALFRIVFGGALVAFVTKVFTQDLIALIYAPADVRFTYWAFGWVWQGNETSATAMFVIYGLAAFTFMIGFHARVAAAILFMCASWDFLQDQSNYLNHLYLVCLLAFLSVFLPLDSALSVDAWRKGRGVWGQRVPCWTQWALRAQIGAVYFFGGVAKLKPDWLQGEPLRDWVVNAFNKGRVPELFLNEFIVMGMSWGGLLYDLLVVPFLIWRKTRLFAVAATLVFHITNSQMFSIGIFPWLMLLSTPIFFEPDFMRRAVQRVFQRGEASPPQSQTPILAWAPSSFAVALLVAHFFIQAALPLRHFFYPSEVIWSEEGLKYAWHMRLRQKSGKALFYVEDVKTGRRHGPYSPDELQHRKRFYMACKPEMLLVYAHHLGQKALMEYPEGVRVFAEVQCRLNHHPKQPMIDPTRDLMQVRDGIAPADWILPMERRAKGIVTMKERYSRPKRHQESKKER